MSWRTHGFYKRLTKAERQWLKKFDRKWDTKAEGRSREDAYDHMKLEGAPSAIRPKSHRRRTQLNELPMAEPEESSLERELRLLPREVARFTVPRRAAAGWSIHLVLTSGERVRVRFADESSAMQAYRTLLEALSVVSEA